WLAGRNAGGDDARTARVRGYEPRPREPPSLHFQDRIRKAPFGERDVAPFTDFATTLSSFVSSDETTT
ncbi:MAG TPA: hypothetical protein VJ728_06910, partial [Candidatus Binataceae bacterium]|nr:hypothetical protein [Candidatus Binataceae bacterium]